MSVLRVLGLLACVVLPSGGFDVSDVCTKCSCQYLLSSQLSDTSCIIEGPVLEVNCSSRPKVTQNANQLPNAPTSNASPAVLLSYRHAGLTSLQPFTMFDPLNVTSLSLDHNKLVYIPPRALTGLRNLRSFTASHNDINSVAPDAFKGLKYLRHLDLSFNSLHNLDFKIVLESSLVYLDVHNNNIKSVLNPETKITTLETMDLSENNITDFPLLFFTSFPNLRTLNISYNDLGVLSSDFFHELSELVVLDASGNYVKEVNRRVVESLKNLKKLFLSDNVLKDVSFVEVLPSLVVLDLSRNNLSFLGDRPLNQKLQRLSVSNNNLTDLSHVFKVFENLKSLDGSWNPTSVFPEHVRAGLRELVLDGTRLNSWPAQRPGEGKIDHLSLSHIPGITSLGPYAFSGILKKKNESGKCVTLKISNTSLSSIDEDALRDLEICQLDLSHNKLRWLPEGLLPWNSLVGVDLQHNPWHCDCALQWMVTSLVPTIYKYHQSLLDDVRCASPENLQGTRLVHWLYHGEAALCTNKEAMLTAKARSSDAHPLLVTLSSSPLMLAVLLALSVLAAMLVILAFALQRRSVRMRKLRRNRRF
ncbi:leucine-rich repeat-containing protein 70-like [Macrosteles quadrilineatus]|uniref:leucine-rich repeat-containing protein 70-like n=1 Tax=Macrosteles quadrilineatus TaxID=74068 RepID=UPI0023E10258|nr:leucine-rich repeat-containing protein 70-like [Macrosteles quadrilineatus]